MNKENAISRINKYGKIGKIVTIIMIVIVSISFIATLVAAITLKNLPENLITLKIGTQAELVMNPPSIDPNFDKSQLEMIKKAFDTGNAGLNLGIISMKFDSAEVVGDTIVAYSNDNAGIVSMHALGNALLVAVASLVLTLISLVFASRLCAAFQKCESPFENNVIKKMRTFAWSLLPWAVFSTVPENVINSILGNKIEIGISLDMNIIFTVLVILALTIVFKYGAMLQQESDETL